MSTQTMPEPEIASLEGEYAGFVTRFVAFIIDILIINVTTLAVTGVVVLIFGFFQQLYLLLPWASRSPTGSWTALVSGIAATGTLVVMIWLYPTIFWMINGQTFGKRIMGLRVVRMDGEEMTFVRGLLRVLGYWLAAIPLFLGYIWVIFSNKRRGWHDMLAGTCVIYSWDAKGSTAMIDRLRMMRQMRRAGKDS